MSLATRIARLLATVGLSVVAAVGVVPAPAHALYICPAESICLYQHKDYGGRTLAISVPSNLGQPNLHLFACPGCRSSEHSGSYGTWGDQMSSWTNTSSVSICAYQHTDYRGGVLPLPAGGSVTLVAGNWNDEVSSFRPCPVFP